MKAWILIPFVFALAASVTSVAGQPGAPEARGLKLLEPAFQTATARTLESAPARFEIVLEREMPTPGWVLNIDGVEVDEAAGRIVVRASEHPPEGVAAQVLTPTTLTIPLERLARGIYTLEIRLRRGHGVEYTPAHAMVLSAF